MECGRCPLEHIQVDTLCTDYCKDMEDFMNEHFDVISDFIDLLLNQPNLDKTVVRRIATQIESIRKL